MKQPCFDKELFEYIIGELASGHSLDEKYRDHELQGRNAGLTGCRECHIKPDWLLVYKQYEKELVLYLMRTGTHSDIF